MTFNQSILGRGYHRMAQPPRWRVFEITSFGRNAQHVVDVALRLEASVLKSTMIQVVDDFGDKIERWSSHW